MNEFVEKNHYVPESYLKKWGNANGKISVYRILVPNQNMPLWKNASPRGLANHRHLYTKVVTSEETDEIERWFNTEFESPAAASIEKVISDIQLSPDDWKNLIRFLAVQDVRTPARLIEMMKRTQDTLPKLMDDVLKDTVRKLIESKETGVSPFSPKATPSDYLPIKVTKEFLEGEDNVKLGVECVVGRSFWLHSIKHLLTNTINILSKHKWTILRSPVGFNWLTTDDPVIKLNYHNSNKYDFGGGWGSIGTEIFLPVSPRHLIYTKIGSKPDLRGTILTKDQAMLFQRIIIEHAHRYIFSSSQDSFVNQTRPRTVSLEFYNEEKTYWGNWHSQNIDAEKNL